MRHLISTTLFATWAILIAACTQPAGETIINDNTKVYEDGSVYVGDLTDGKRHGQGTHLPFEGDRYRGEWANDQKSGQGRLIYNDGSIYEGSFLNDVPEGQGVRTFESEAFGYKYSGTFAAGKQAGRGEEQKRNGKVIEVYKGEFHDGKRNGKGTLTRKLPGLKDFKYVGDFNTETTSSALSTTMFPTISSLLSTLQATFFPNLVNIPSRVSMNRFSVQVSGF